MRLSTIVFLLIFGGLFGHLHRSHGEAFLNCSADEFSQDQGAQVRTLEKELRSADKQFRRNWGTLSKLETNIARLQDLTRRAERDLGHNLDAAEHPLAVEQRRQNLRRMKRDLEEVLGGHRTLQIAQERLEGERAAMQAKLELAKAGLWHAEPEALTSVESPRHEPESRPSPIDALSDLTSPRD